MAVFRWGAGGAIAPPPPPPPPPPPEEENFFSIDSATQQLQVQIIIVANGPLFSFPFTL